MTLKEKLNEYALDRYHVLQYIYNFTGNNEGSRSFIYALNDFIDHFIGYLNDDIITKLDNLYTLICQEWGLNPNDFVLTAYND